MTPIEAAILGVVEGLTEFLPVSSTGHLSLVSSAMGHDDDATKALDVVIQAGAIVAVAIYYRKLFVDLVKGVVARDRDKLRLAGALAVAFIPAAVVGLALHKKIKELLFGPKPVAYALIVGGVAMIAVEVWRRAKKVRTEAGLEKVTLGRALAIGIAQCASLWPGTSRSMSTIIGGQVSGLDTPTAAEFSFLLSVPVLGAATAFDLVKSRHELLDSPTGPTALVIGLVTAFIVSMLAIAGFLRYLKRYGLLPFGLYRIVLGVVVLVLVARGILAG